MLRQLARRGYRLCGQSALLRRLAQSSVFAPLKRALRERLEPRAKGEYELWLEGRVAERVKRHPWRSEPGLLSFITPAWNTPPQFLNELALSLRRQRGGTRSFEWVVFDNGSTSPETRQCLDRLAAVPWTRVVRSETNLGIAGGMRRCLELATGRYVCPVDHDDLLFPDAVAIVAHHIQSRGYPAALYTDEDHLGPAGPCLAYFKPDWDPVLCLNSAYIAHLQVLDRRQALTLGVYSNPQAEGSCDWDAMVRFHLAGHEPVHIREMLYHWREHAASTAANFACKSYVFDSQRAVLQNFVGRQSAPHRYQVEPSPLFNGTPDWWIRRRPVDPAPLAAWVLGGGNGTAPAAHWQAHTDYPAARVEAVSHTDSWDSLLARVDTALRRGEQQIALVSDQLRPQRPDWVWEAVGLFELFPDTAMVGGRISNQDHRLVDGGRVLGFGDGVGFPDLGRHVSDVGYYVQMHKPRSVSCVSSRYCVIETAFLRRLLAEHRKHPFPLAQLGVWAGALALRTGRRVICSPFLHGATDEPWDQRITEAQHRTFVDANRDLLPDNRFYPASFSLETSRPYQLIPGAERFVPALRAA